MKLQISFLVLSSLLLNLVNSAPSPRRDLVKSALESRSNNSSGVISIPFKRHRRENNGAQAVRRDGQLGQVNLINGGPDIDILAELQFGTPPQTFEIQIDTGSSLLMVEGPEFNSPSNTDLKTPYTSSFDPSKSSTWSSLNRTVTYRYGDNTYFRANMIQDTVTFGGYELANAPFSVSFSGNITFPPRGSGILGLSFSPLNNRVNQPDPYDPFGSPEAAADATFTIPYVQQLYELGALNEPLFSFNFLVQSENKEATDESPGGELLLGGVDDSLYEGEIVYSSLLIHPSFSPDYPSTWTVAIQGVSFNGNLLPNSQFAAVFDSGTTISQLPFSIVNNIFAQITTPVYALTEGNFAGGTAWFFECEDDFSISAFPVSITIGNSQFDIPFGYLVTDGRLLIDGKKICSFNPTSVPDESDFVIGQDLISSLYTVFRFSPPAIGVAKLSDKARSENPLPSDIKGLPSLSKSSFNYGTSTNPTLFTPTPKPEMTEVNPTLVLDPTTTVLPFQPTILGTASILTPTFTSLAAQTGNGSGNGDGGDKSSSESKRVSHLTICLAVAISGLLIPIFVL